MKNQINADSSGNNLPSKESVQYVINELRLAVLLVRNTAAEVAFNTNKLSETQRSIELMNLIDIIEWRIKEKYGVDEEW